MIRLKWVAKLIAFLDKWFPDHFKESGLTLWKARLLVSIHVFIFLLVIALYLVSLIYGHEDMPALGLACILLSVLIFVFLKWHNFILSGNLLALMIFMVLFPSVLETGGLYSDNLLWMIMIPLLSLLFANRVSGFCWLLALLGVSIYLYSQDELTHLLFKEQITGFDNTYYLISYAGLFVMVVGIVLVFATGQNLMIKALHEKQIELSQQKQEIFKQAQSLREAEAKLIESNKELEQFAYAASHDLKEPLRMIGTYCQLIQRKLNGNHDAATGEYLNYVTDGVKRMDKLLTDLLDYSRLGRNESALKETNLNEILFVVINNLMTRMQETDTSVYTNHLPVIRSTSTEMIQLFQNLVANSIKFRRKEATPVIEINHSIKENVHHFSFRDNGIGIPDQHHKSIFEIFERLHSKQDYEGSGIGLATCKKIINNMGGEIWVEPSSLPGTTFRFTIPVNA